MYGIEYIMVYNWYMSTRTLHPDSKAQDNRGIPETMVCRILPLELSSGRLKTSGHNLSTEGRYSKGLQAICLGHIKDRHRPLNWIHVLLAYRKY